MCYYLFESLREVWFGFNIFRYITVRASCAALTSFFLCLIVGPPVIRLLGILNVGETTERPEAPKLRSYHGKKAGTPTMGGILIVGSLLASCALWARFDNAFTWIAAGVTAWLCLFGIIDDYLKIRHKRKRGLSAHTKFAGQIIAGLAVAGILKWIYSVPAVVYLPFAKDVVIPLGLMYIPFVILVITGSSNSVNLTDGLDGLAIGCMIIISGTFAVICYVSGHAEISAYLGIPYIPRAAELTVFCAALIGSGLGFLWFNSHPAELFMGDTGSLALGGAIGTVAVLIKKELLLFFVGGVFVIEALSVIAQVTSFRMRRTRLFLMAPLHHHFQLREWPESKITIRFWIIAILCALFTLMTLKLQ